MNTVQQLETRIRTVLQDHGRLSKPIDQIDSSTDLYQAGMTSQASVNVMLALESTFNIEFADHMLKRSVFSSVASIRDAVVELIHP
jgi:acyl carrier protein